MARMAWHGWRERGGKGRGVEGGERRKEGMGEEISQSVHRGRLEERKESYESACVGQQLHNNAELFAEELVDNMR